VNVSPMPTVSTASSSSTTSSSSSADSSCSPLSVSTSSTGSSDSSVASSGVVLVALSPPPNNAPQAPNRMSTPKMINTHLRQPPRFFCCLRSSSDIQNPPLILIYVIAIYK